MLLVIVKELMKSIGDEIAALQWTIPLILKRIKTKTRPDGPGQVGLTDLYPWAKEKSSPSLV